MDFRSLLRENGLAAATIGLLTLTYEGPGNTLFPALVFSNEKTGFSLNADFTAEQEAGEGKENSRYYPAVLINRPNPLLGFKSKVKFTPRVLLSNTTSGFLAANLEASFELPGSNEVQTVSLPVAPLAPVETRLLDFSGFREQGLIPEEAAQVSLKLLWPGAPGDLAARVFTVDETGDYSFGIEALRGAFPRYDAISWYIAGNWQSLINVQNISEEEMQVRIVLSYDNGAGSYELPLLTVPPRATRTVNLREVIATAQPDKDGNVIPMGTLFGTATVEAADGRVAPRLLAAGAEYDPVVGVGGATFFPCTGVEFINLIQDPTEGLVGGFDFMLAEAVWSDGQTTDITADSTFDSLDPAIATLQNGGVDHGKVEFVSEGGTSGIASAFVPFSSPEDPTFCNFEFLLALAALLACIELGCFDPPSLAGFRIEVAVQPVQEETNSIVSGQSFQLQVEAIDTMGNLFTGYRGTVSFRSSDATATLPANYTYIASNNGIHFFNVTLKSVTGTSPTRELIVSDLSASGIPQLETRKDIFVWFNVNMDAEFWKNCGFVVCPDLGSYFCQTSYDPNGWPQKTSFIALTNSDPALANKTVTVRKGGAKAVSFVGDAGPVLNQPYWNTGAPPPATAGCVTDLLMDQLGMTHGCNGSLPFGGGVVFWRFGQ